MNSSINSNHSNSSHGSNNSSLGSDTLCETNVKPIIIPDVYKHEHEFENNQNEGVRLGQYNFGNLFNSLIDTPNLPTPPENQNNIHLMESEPEDLLNRRLDDLF